MCGGSCSGEGCVLMDGAVYSDFASAHAAYVANATSADIVLVGNQTATFAEYLWIFGGAMTGSAANGPNDALETNSYLWLLGNWTTSNFTLVATTSQVYALNFQRLNDEDTGLVQRMDIRCTGPNMRGISATTKGSQVVEDSITRGCARGFDSNSQADHAIVNNHLSIGDVIGVILGARVSSVVNSEFRNVKTGVDAIIGSAVETMVITDNVFSADSPDQFTSGSRMVSVSVSLFSDLGTPPTVTVLDNVAVGENTTAAYEIGLRLNNFDAVGYDLLEVPKFDNFIGLPDVCPTGDEEDNRNASLSALYWVNEEAFSIIKLKQDNFPDFTCVDGCGYVVGDDCGGEDEDEDEEAAGLGSEGYVVGSIFGALALVGAAGIIVKTRPTYKPV